MIDAFASYASDVALWLAISYTVHWLFKLVLSFISK